MRKYKITHAESGETHVHYDGPWSDFTLCGDAMDIDRHAAISFPEQTDEPVTCFCCLQAVEHVLTHPKARKQ